MWVFWSMTRGESGLSLVHGKLSLMVTRLWCLTGTEAQGYHPHDPALYSLFKIIIKRHKIPPMHNERILRVKSSFFLNSISQIKINYNPYIIIKKY